ncbi:MAG: hypothetical protein ACU83U_11610 [Gammaproteobacteria bacterium]
MFKLKTTKLIKLISIISFINSLSSIALAGETRSWVRPLLPSTGFNSDCNQPIFQLPPPLPADMHFDFIGLYNPNSAQQGNTRDALPLTTTDCRTGQQQYVATTTNPMFLAINGFSEPDPRLKNLLTNQVPIINAPNGYRVFPESQQDNPTWTTISAAQTPALTLAGFRNVKGLLKLVCFNDGTAKVSITLNHYTPHEVLTVWALWLLTLPGAQHPVPMPLPFGGVPNVLIPDQHGQASFDRTLAFCPMDIQANGDQLMFLDIASHLDGSVYGATPDTALLSTLFVTNSNPAQNFTGPLSSGITTVNRGVIRIMAEPVSYQQAHDD